MKKQSIEWKELLSKEEELSSLRYNYFKLDTELILKDIKVSFKTNDRLPIVLSILEKMSDQIKRNLIDELVFTAVNGPASYLGAAKDIILNLDKDWLNMNISSSIDKVLNANIEHDYLDYVYRNIADLLNDLHFKSKLIEFITKYCKHSKDQDIIEIYTDFSSN
ncbi:hypothetical protein AAG747_05610 [Rapidithrix thailandica]|uniref:Uncharacterized protein n=1 Tax=Rapidithrix thailandica TaxID=413964 RepID=A0AAW9S1A0_9BACT